MIVVRPRVLLMTPHIEGGDIVEPLHERVLGRVLAEDVIITRQVTILLSVQAPC